MYVHNNWAKFLPPQYPSSTSATVCLVAEVPCKPLTFTDFLALVPCVQQSPLLGFFLDILINFTTSLLSRLSFLFIKNIVLAPSSWRGESKCFAKPLAPPAKDSLRSSFASGGLSRLQRSILALCARGLFLTDRVKPSLWQRLLLHNSFQWY